MGLQRGRGFWLSGLLGKGLWRGVLHVICQSGSWKSALISSSSNGYLYGSYYADTGWLTNDSDKSIVVSASGGTGYRNRCDLTAYIFEIGAVASSHNANDSWSKVCSLAFSVPPKMQWRVTSSPYGQGNASFRIYAN